MLSFRTLRFDTVLRRVVLLSFFDDVVAVAFGVVGSIVLVLDTAFGVVVTVVVVVVVLNVVALPLNRCQSTGSVGLQFTKQ